MTEQLVDQPGRDRQVTAPRDMRSPATPVRGRIRRRMTTPARVRPGRRPPAGTDAAAGPSVQAPAAAAA